MIQIVSNWKANMCLCLYHNFSIILFLFFLFLFMLFFFFFFFKSIIKKDLERIKLSNLNYKKSLKTVFPFILFLVG